MEVCIVIYIVHSARAPLVTAESSIGVIQTPSSQVRSTGFHQNSFYGLFRYARVSTKLKLVTLESFLKTSLPKLQLANLLGTPVPGKACQSLLGPVLRPARSATGPAPGCAVVQAGHAAVLAPHVPLLHHLLGGEVKNIVN